jgi:WD40 repeat protein
MNSDHHELSPGWLTANPAEVYIVSAAEAEHLRKRLDDAANRVGDPPLLRRLLLVCALLGTRGLDPDVVHAAPIANYLRTVSECDAHAADIDDALLVLHEHELLRVRLTGPYRVVHVPAPVRQVVLGDVPSAEPARIARLCADALVCCWPTTIADVDLDLVRALRSAQSLHTYVGDYLITREAGGHPVLSLFGRSIGQAGLSTDARDVLRNLAWRTTQVLGADHPDTLRSRANAASWLGKTGDWPGSLAEFTELLGMYQRILGDTHTDTLATRASRATYLARSGDLTAAITELEAVLSARTILLGPHHSDTLVTRARLIGWRARAGHVHEAVADFEAVLADFLAHQPKEVKQISLSRASLATWRGHAGDPLAAVAGHRANLTEMLRNYGTDNLDTVVSRKTLVHWCERAGQYAEAAAERAELNAAARVVLERYENVVGPDHPDLHELRATLIASGASDAKSGADVAELRALLADQERSTGASHPATIARRSDLAVRLGQSGDPAGAVAEFHELLAQAEPVIGRSHPDVLKAMAQLASWQGRAGDPAAAAHTLQDLLDRQEQFLGRRHHHVRTTLSSLAKQYTESKNRIAAGETLAALLAHQRRRPRASAHEILRTTQHVIVWQAECGQTKTTVDHLRKISQQLADLVGQLHPDTLEARFQAVRWLDRTKRRSQAEAELNRLLKDQIKYLRQRHPQVIRSRRLLKQWQVNPEPRQSARYIPRHPTTGLMSHGANGWKEPVGALARLVNSSRTAGPLLEVLALCSTEPVPRQVWLLLASALSPLALVGDSDVDDLLAHAGPYLIAEPIDDDICYRINADLGQRVLTRAAGRTGLGPIDPVLRHNTLAHALLSRFTDGPVHDYAARNLPHHAAAGGCLGRLGRHEILDDLDLDALTAVLWEEWLGGAPLPDGLSDLLQIRHLLAAAAPADRATIRGLINPQVASRPDVATPVWTVTWTQRTGDPTHLALVGGPTGDADHEIRALAHVRWSGRNLLIVGRLSGELEVWDTGTGRRVRSDMYGPANLTALDVTVLDDVQVLAAVGEWHCRLWNLTDESSWDNPLIEVDGGIRAAGFVRRDDRGSLLAIAEGSGHLTLWDPVEGRVADRSIARLTVPATDLCTFVSQRHPSDCVAVIGGHVTIWETEPLRLTDVTVPADRGPITSMATVVDGASMRLWVGYADGHIAVHDPYTGLRHSLIPAHDGPVEALTTMRRADGHCLVVSGGTDGTIRLWNTLQADDSGPHSTGIVSGYGNPVHTLAIPQRGPKRLASAAADGTVRLWHLSRMRDLPVRPTAVKPPITTITAVEFDEPSSRYLVTGHRDGLLRLHDLAIGQPVGDPICPHPSSIQILINLPGPSDQALVATVGADSTTRLWDLGGFTPPIPSTMIAELPWSDAGVPTAVAASRCDDLLLAIGDSSGVVRLWDGRRGVSTSIRTHAGMVTSMLFPPLHDGVQHLVTGGSDHTISLWIPNAHDGTLTQVGHSITVGSAPINALTMLSTEGGPIIATGAENGDIHLLDPQSRVVTAIPRSGDDAEPLMKLTSIRSLDGQWLLLGISKSGTLRLWRSDTLEPVHCLRLEGPTTACHVFGSKLVMATHKGLSLLALTMESTER